MSFLRGMISGQFVEDHAKRAKRQGDENTNTGCATQNHAKHAKPMKELGLGIARFAPLPAPRIEPLKSEVLIGPASSPYVITPDPKRRKLWARSGVAPFLPGELDIFASEDLPLPAKTRDAICEFKRAFPEASLLDYQCELTRHDSND